MTGPCRGTFLRPRDQDRNTSLSVIHTQTGISASAYYHVSDSVVLGIDYFRYKASWYGAPLAGGGKLAGELQVLQFLNAGVTYHW